MAESVTADEGGGVVEASECSRACRGDAEVRAGVVERDQVVGEVDGDVLIRGQRLIHRRAGVTQQFQVAAVQGHGTGAEADAAGRAGVVEGQAGVGNDAGVSAVLERDRACVTQCASAACHDAAEVDGRGAIGIRRRKRQNVRANLRESEGTGNSTAERDVAARRTAAGGIDPVGTDAGVGREDEGAVHCGRACGAVHQGTQRVAGGGEVRAPGTVEGEEL